MNGAGSLEPRQGAWCACHHQTRLDFSRSEAWRRAAAVSFARILPFLDSGPFRPCNWQSLRGSSLHPSPLSDAADGSQGLLLTRRFPVSAESRQLVRFYCLLSELSGKEPDQMSHRLPNASSCPRSPHIAHHRLARGQRRGPARCCAGSTPSLRHDPRGPPEAEMGCAGTWATVRTVHGAVTPAGGC